MKTVFISLKLKNSIHYIITLVSTYIKDDESLYRVAKELRKNICNNPRSHGLMNNVKPSDIQWAVYNRISSDEGIIFHLLVSSENSNFESIIKW